MQDVGRRYTFYDKTLGVTITQTSPLLIHHVSMELHPTFYFVFVFKMIAHHFCFFADLVWSNFNPIVSLSGNGAPLSQA